MASQTQKGKSSLGLVLLLLLLLGLLFLALSSIHVQTNTATQTSSEGQCLSNGKGFNTPQEAFTLAQEAEEYRSANPFKGNYGLASYTICYKDGTQQRFQSDPAPGYTSTPGPNLRPNDTHSKQTLYKWLEEQLASITIDPSQTTAIYVVIFSQVRVCQACQSDMVTWQRTLRQAAKTRNLYLSVWDIRPGTKSVIIPATYPAGTGTPVVLEDLRRVPIQFAP